MKKSDKYNVVCLVVCIVLLFFALLLGVMKEYSPYLLAGFSLVGLAVCYFVHFALHEVGHLIFAKIAKMKCIYFEISGFAVDKTSKQTKYYHRYSPEGGEIAVYGKTPENSGKGLTLTAFGGLLFSAIFIFLCLFFGLFFDNVYCFSILFVGSCSSIFVLLINLNPFSVDSDGVTVFFRKSEVYKERVKCQEIFTRLVLGEDITQMNPDLFVGNGAEIKAYIALRKTCLNDIEEAKAVYDEILEDKINSTATIFEERFYIALILKDEEYIDKNCEMATAYLSLEDSPASFRIQAALRDYRGDKQWSNLLRTSAKKALDNYLVKGMVIAEQKLTALYFGEEQ